MPKQIQIRGTHCPVCGGPLLFNIAAAVINCATTNCSRPSAAHELLGDSIIEHRARITTDGITVRHPLHERLDNALMSCPILDELDELFDNPDELPAPADAIYEVTRSAAGLALEVLR